MAVVGSSKTVEDAKEYFVDAAAGFEGKGEKHPNLHPDFPGLGNLNPFRCKFEIPDGATAALPQSKIDAIRKEVHHGKADVARLFAHLLPGFLWSRIWKKTPMRADR